MQFALDRVDGDIDAGDQGFQTGDACQRDARLDQPEARVAAQVVLRLTVDFQGCLNALQIFADMQIDHLADGNSLVHHLGFVDLDAFAVGELHADFHTRLAEGPPEQPQTDEQSQQRQHPDGRPVAGSADFRGGQFSHRRDSRQYCPRSAEDRR